MDSEVGLTEFMGIATLSYRQADVMLREGQVQADSYPHDHLPHNLRPERKRRLFEELKVGN